MRFLKNRVLWLSLYAVLATGVFLFLLFPSRLALQQLEAAAGRAGMVVKAASLRPTLPLGIGLKQVMISLPQAPAGALIQGEWLDLQFNPFSLFWKNKTVHFQGKAYSGRFDGYAGFALNAQTRLPAEGKINFYSIDLTRLNPAAVPLIKGLSGQVRGAAYYTGNDANHPNLAGKLSLYLARGAYLLPEPFLGMQRIAFDRGEIQAQLKNGSVRLQKLEIYGTQVNFFISGDIQLADRIEESRLNLKGVLELAGKNKVKMNVTLGGTLASPSFRYL